MTSPKKHIRAKDVLGVEHDLSAVYWAKLLFKQGVLTGVSPGAISGRRRTSEKNNNCYTPEQIVGTEKIIYMRKSPPKKIALTKSIVSDFFKKSLVAVIK